MLSLFASAYLEISKGNPQENYAVNAFEPFPMSIEQSIIPVVESYKEWIVHRTDLDMSQLAQFTRLQLWTVKPALEK